MSLAVKAARAQAAGDPGLFGSIGKFFGGVAKTVGGIIGGPVGFGLKTLGGFVAPAPGVAPAPRTTFAQRGRFGVSPALAGLRAQSFGVGGVPQQIAAPAAGVGIACPAGMHANKSAYFLRDGTFVAKGSRCVPSRRRNPANARANDRAIGRIESAKKMAARLGRISIRKECPK